MPRNDVGNSAGLGNGAKRQKAPPRRIRFTQTAIERLNPPAEGRVEYWDTQLPGFGLRVSAARPGQPARKAWQCMYRVNGKLSRETLGTLAMIPKVEDARAKARESMTKAGAGLDPIAERKAAERNILASVLDDYLNRYAVHRMRLAYYNETKRAFNVDVKPALGAKVVSEITRRDIRELLDGIVERGSPSHANHVLSYLRAALNWAVANDYMEANSCNGLNKPGPIVQRDRALGDNEIRAFWLACDNIGNPFGPLFQLLLLTGQRRGEVAGATWPEFDLAKALWTLPGARTKNGEEHLVHLSKPAVRLLESLPRIDDDGLLFTTTGDTQVSGWSIASKRLVREMLGVWRQQDGEEKVVNIKPFTRHDLRRTAATGMAALGIAPHVVDKILNHSTGKISGVAAIYNRFEYLEDRKAALEAWARHVEGLVQLGNRSRQA